MSTQILLFRRDLRLADHPALSAAAAAGPVLPVYLHDPDAEGDWAPGAASRWWLHHSLGALHQALAARGSRLHVLTGDSLSVLQRLLSLTGATAVHWSRCYEPAAIARDKRLKSALVADGIAVHSHPGLLLCEPWRLATGEGRPYRVYSPFARRLRAGLDVGSSLPAPDTLPLPSSLPQLPAGAAAIDDLGLLPTIRWDEGLAARWQPGEAGAAARLEAFFEAAAAVYDRQRDLPAVDGSSRLSPHLHFGEISPRQAWLRTERARAEAGDRRGLDHFQRELLWREFAYHLIYHFPDTAEAPLNARFADFPWRSGDDYGDDLVAWQRGATGIPIVDAGMRQLWHTGWMHNRVRMIVASFLTKNLLIPWQAGARWFWDTLVDADLASNTLGWQWAAGCGADAAPYFRIFNPVLQSRKFDADGRYLRQWLPELSALPDPALHAPWASTAALATAGLRLGRDYPEPRVDLKASRERALAAWERLKEA